MKIGDKVFAYDERQGVKVGYFVGEVFKGDFHYVVSTDQKVVTNINEQNYSQYKEIVFCATPSRIFPYNSRKYVKYRNTVYYFNKNYINLTFKKDYFQLHNRIYDNQYGWGRFGLFFEIWKHRISYALYIFFKTLLEFIFLPITVFINYLLLNIDSNKVVGELRTQRKNIDIKNRFPLPKEEIEATKKSIIELEKKEQALKAEKKELKNIFIAIILPILAAIIPLYLVNKAEGNKKSEAITVNVDLSELNKKLDNISSKIEHFDRNIDFHIDKYLEGKKKT